MQLQTLTAISPVAAINRRNSSKGLYLPMQLQTLTAISPVDGRYRRQLQHLDEYFSEYALMKYRIKVEVEYFFLLAENKFFKLPPSSRKYLQKVHDNFSIEDAQRIKETEKITNHD